MQTPADQTTDDRALLAARYTNTMSWWQVIWWWESRRIRYNIIVGIAGIICVPLYLTFLYLAHDFEPGEDAIEPLMIIFGPFIVNILYTGGWVAELILRFIWKDTSPDIGRILYRTGVTFSLIVVAFPTLYWFARWLL